MDMRLANSRNDEGSRGNRDVTKLPLTVPVEDRPSVNQAEVDQDDVTKLPLTVPVKG